MSSKTYARRLQTVTDHRNARHPDTLGSYSCHYQHQYTKQQQQQQCAQYGASLPATVTFTLTTSLSKHHISTSL